MAGPPDTEDLGEPRGDRKWSWVLSLEIFCILRKGSGPEGKRLATICHPLLAHQTLPYASQPADKHLKFIEDRAFFRWQGQHIEEEVGACLLVGNAAAISQPFLNPTLT